EPGGTVQRRRPDPHPDAPASGAVPARPLAGRAGGAGPRRRGARHGRRRDAGLRTARPRDRRAARRDARGADAVAAAPAGGPAPGRGGGHRRTRAAAPHREPRVQHGPDPLRRRPRPHQRDHEPRERPDRGPRRGPGAADRPAAGQDRDEGARAGPVPRPRRRAQPRPGIDPDMTGEEVTEEWRAEEPRPSKGFRFPWLALAGVLATVVAATTLVVGIGDLLRDDRPPDRLLPLQAAAPPVTPTPTDTPESGPETTETPERSEPRLYEALLRLRFAVGDGVEDGDVRDDVGIDLTNMIE